MGDTGAAQLPAVAALGSAAAAPWLFLQGEQVGDALTEAAGEGPAALMGVALVGLASVIAALLKHQRTWQQKMLDGELVPRRVDEALDKMHDTLADILQKVSER